MKNLAIRFLKWLLNFFLEDEHKITDKINEKKKNIEKIDKELQKDINLEDAKDEIRKL